MAINFPNYLAAALVQPDFSGLGDSVSNYYAGKMKPKDDLIKQIQAEFARPNAEVALQGSRLGLETGRLGNEKSRLEIAKLRREMAQQAELENQIKAALSGAVGGAQTRQPSGQPMPQMPQGGLQMGPQQPSPDNMTFQQGQPAAMGGLPPAIAQALQNMRQNAPQNPDSAAGAMPPALGQQLQPEAQQDGTEQPSAVEQPQIITPGTPRLEAIDNLYDQNPLSREYLEKKGFKKKTEVKFDPKTGQTRILTTYPSGKVTLQLVGSAAKGEDGIPLTNAVITQHQKTISAIDNVIPTLEEIKEKSNFPITNLGALRSTGGSRDYADYQSLVGESLDKLMSAFNLPRQKESIETVRHMVERRSGETVSDYKNRISSLIKKLEKQKNYSASEIKRSNKIQPVGRSDSQSQDTYSSDEWEAV